jgi:hypothetical protein
MDPEARPALGTYPPLLTPRPKGPRNHCSRLGRQTIDLFSLPGPARDTAARAGQVPRPNARLSGWVATSDTIVRRETCRTLDQVSLPPYTRYATQSPVELFPFASATSARAQGCRTTGPGTWPVGLDRVGCPFGRIGRQPQAPSGSTI